MATFQEVTGVFDVGTLVNFADETEVYAKQNISLQCRTAAGVVTLTLPPISTLSGFQNVVLLINDLDANAGTNNIVINAAAGDLINNATVLTLNTDNAAAAIFIGGRDKWISFNAGSGSIPTPFVIGQLNVDSTIVGQPFVADRPYPAANPGQAFEVVITAANQDKGIIGGTAGAGGIQVEDGDIVYCIAISTGGNQAAAGADFIEWTGELLQFWENGDENSPNSIRQIQLTDPNTADGVSAVVKGQGNSVTGGATAVNNDVCGEGHTIDGTNANGANDNHVSGELNSIVDTTATANNNNLSGSNNTANSSDDNSMSGTDNTLTTSDDNIVSGAGNTITTGLRNLVSGDTVILNTTNNSIVAGASTSVNGSLGFGASNNLVTGDGNSIIDAVGLAAGDNAISGADNTLTSSNRNNVSGDTNSLTGGANNVIAGDGNTMTSPISATQNNIIGGETHTIIDTGSCLIGGATLAPTNVTQSTLNGESHTITNVTNSSIHGQSHTVTGSSNTSVQGLNAESIRANAMVLASGQTAAVGDNQTEWIHLKASTTNAVETTMLNDGANLAIPSGVAWTMTVQVLGADLGTGAAGTAGDVTDYFVTCIARNIGGTVTVVNKLNEATGQTTLLGAVDVEPNGGATDVVVNVTGEVNKNVSWGASLKITQVDFV